ncbi:hypothetical protein GCM10009122_39190 [Fulvivirga kasyanovii]|uniref:non-ribosomal peptide synthase/polyketide synthase n=1 Tax=Fulvivirga kasyanovii TaxID=396812 RepID=UPI0031DDE95F
MVDGYSMSLQQKRAWSLEKEIDQKFNNTVVININGPVDRDILRKSVEQLVLNNEIFKTHLRISPVKKYPEQVLSDQPLYSYKEVDAYTDENLLTSLDRQAGEAFDLSSGDIARFTLYSPENGGAHKLVVQMPALCSDYKTLIQLGKDVLSNYQTLDQGGQIEENDALQYIDFTEWQREVLTAEEIQKATAYWKSVFNPDDLKQRLSFEEVSDDSGFNIKPADIEISEGIKQHLENIAQDSSLSVVLLASWYTFLQRFCKNDLLLGWLYEGRSDEQLQQVYGKMGKYVPLKLDDPEELNFVQIVEQVQRFQAKHQKHLDAFTLDPVNEQGQVRYMPYAFDFVEMPSFIPQKSNHYAIDYIKVTDDIFNLKLKCSYTEDKELSLSVEYAGKCFSAEKIEHLSISYASFLEQLVSAPEKPISQLQVEESEKELILNRLSKGNVLSFEPATVVAKFEKQVLQTPDNLALSFGNDKLTYDELNKLANQFAHFLISQGVNQNDVVAIKLERSERMLVAILGILKAGAIYLPVDAGSPAERTNFILEDSVSKVLIVDDNQPEVPESIGVKVVSLNDCWKTLSEYSSHNLKLDYTPDDTTYIIYTSGTTGKPKGVRIGNASLMNYVEWFCSTYNIGESDSTLLFASIAFDLSYTSLWSSLLSGAALCIFKETSFIEPAELAACLIENQITYVKLTPSHFKLITGSINFEKEIENYALRLIVLGGEAIATDDIDKYLKLKNKVVFVNHYGPTETTIGTIAQTIDKENFPTFKANPVLGRPVSNNNIFILNEEGELCPLGVEGEICVSGAGLAQGYLNNEELTKQRFCPNTSVGAEKLYHTGDVGRLLPGGAIEFGGRKDDQVKLRGFRIELGEIKSALTRYDSISDTVIQLRKGKEEEAFLAAYLTATGEIDTAQLQEFLGKYLPDYMIPAYFVKLDKFPLKPNGKVNPDALPDPEQNNLGSGEDYVEPVSEVEKKLVTIWQEILGREKIGIRDNFFKIGGHSLKAIQVISRIYKEINTKMELGNIFSHPTIEELARAIEGTQEHTFEAIPLVGSQEYYELSHAQKRIWVLDQFEENQIAYNIPGAYILEGKLDVKAFEKAFDTLVERHESLRTVFVNVEGEPRQVIRSSGDFSFKMQFTDLRNEQDAETRAKKLADDEASRPFSLEKGPLLRTHLIRLADDKFVFLLTLHHIISDGWSMGVLVKEVLTLYSAYSHGKENPLPALRIQYKDYAAWHNARNTGAEAEANKKYWTDKLAGDQKPLPLPTDFPRTAIQDFKGKTINFHLDKGLSDKMNRFSLNHGGSLFMMLQAVVKTLLYRYTAQEDITVGTVIAGRDHPDFEDQIGFFVNTLALRDQLSGDDTFNEVFDKVKTTIVEAYQHQTYPFDRLVEEIEVKRDISRSPLFDVKVNLQNNESQEWDMQSVSLSALQTEVDFSRYDLTFNFTEIEDGLVLSLSYRTNLYKEDTIRQMFKHLKQLAGNLLNQPQKPVKEQEILSEEEREVLLSIHDEVLEEHQDTVLQMFDARVNDFPDARAVQAGADSITYAGLNSRANQLGTYLRKQGVDKGDVVAIYLDRSVDTVVSIFAVLKAGAAWLPLNTAYPEEMIRHILHDSGAKLVLSEGALAGQLPDAIPVTDLAAVQDKIAELHDDNLQISITRDDLAYIIYTSGTTGQPKGVLISHGNLSHYVAAMSGKLEIRPSTRYLHTAAFSFSSSVRQLMLPLCAGGRLHIAGTDQILDPLALFRLIKREQIDTIDLVPTYWRRAIQELDSLKVSERKELLNNSLTRILIASEPLLSDLPDIWNNKFGHKAQVVCMYGQTETTGIATLNFLTGQTSDNISVVGIGKPLPGLKVYVLDSHQKMAPSGLPGELYVAGATVGMGYLNNPQLNEEKFLYLDLGNGPQRLYRTGDIGRLNSDGTIAFMGRADDQVKVRGFRVEVKQVEHVLMQHEGITNAVVTGWDNPQMEKQLIAYFTGDSTLSATALRNYLGASLPDYMIPARFIQLDQFPLTTSGKIDRSQLPALELAEMEGGKYIAPETDLEKQLTAIWEKLFAKKQIGVKDNFFELGGHSLKGVQLSSLIYKELNISIKLRDIFINPTVEQLAQAISTAPRTSYESIKPVPQQPYYEMSHAQKRLWILDQLEEGHAAYNQPRAFTLDGPLDIQALTSAFRILVGRHESLRTTFVTIDGEPKQKINDYDPLQHELKYIDLRHADDTDQQVEVAFQKEQNESFDLSQGPLIRLQLLQTGDEQYILLFTSHHIISDRWSLEVLTSEVLRLYNALSQGESDPLPSLGIQYRDFAAWQNEQLSGESLAGHKQYWSRKFEGDIPVLELPTSYARPALKTYNGASVNYTIDSKVKHGLEILGRENGASLFMSLMAVTKLLFFRYTGQTDMVVGTPISGREHPDLENQIGLFLNNLAIRTSFNGEGSFTELLSCVKQSMLEAYEHQVYPFDRLIDDLDLERDLSRSPLFDVMVVMLQDSDSQAEVDMHGMQLGGIEADKTLSKIDLTLSFRDMQEGIMMNIEYNTDLFSAEFIDRLFNHYNELARAVTRTAETPVCKLEYLGEKEKQFILHDLNATAIDFEVGTTITEVFEAHVSKSPDAVAVKFEDTALTYSELNKRANKIAHYLRSTYQIEPDDLIGLLVERSEMMIVAIMGILKAGAAYVPVDPAYPEDRINYILSDSRAKLLLHDDVNAGDFDLEALSVNHPCFDDQQETNPEKLHDGDNLAYVIYTSGSTGKPKGVMVEHAGVVNVSMDHITRFEVAGSDNVLQFSPVSFDASACEIFMAMLSGASIVIINKKLVNDTHALLDYMEKKEVNVAAISPSFHNILDLDRLSLLRVIITGGEAVNLNNAIYSSQYSTYINAYGPTECSICVSSYEVTEADKHRKSIPIGRPVSNMQMYVLDKYGQPLPAGVKGELCVAGIGVARGYLNNEELTHEKFIDNPFGTSSKLYRTGDMGRLMPDGNLEFVGRGDDQVKIHGYRVELGEIEAVLSAHPHVEKATVLVRKDKENTKVLAAYFTGSQELAPSELRAFAAKDLPHYMVPSYFIQIEEFKLTAHGKVDQKVLPDPEEAAASEQVQVVAPEGQLEKDLLLIWQNLFNRKKISTTDNFFEIGGHSLKATQLLSRISKDFNCKIELKDIFLNPTIQGLAGVIAGSAESRHVEITPVEPQASYELSHAQKRLWILNQFGGMRAAFNMPAAYEMEGQLEIAHLEKAFVTLVKRHESLRTTFVLEDGVPKQKINTFEQSGFQFGFTDLQEEPQSEAKAREIAYEEANTEFDLSTGPLIRTNLLQVAPDRYVFLITMHHIISDGWSMRVLINEVLSLYDAYSRGEANVLEPLKIQYKDYAAWQNQLLSGEQLVKQQDFWLSQFEGEIPVLDLPTDFPRKKVKTYTGEKISFALDKDISQALRSMGQEHGATLFMTLVASVKALLYKYTGQNDIIIGTPIAGRNHEDLEGQIGFFLNTLALRTAFNAENNFGDLLDKVRDVTIGAFDHQAYPFDKLVDDLKLERDMSRSLLYDVEVELTSIDLQSDGPDEISGVDIKRYDTGFSVSKDDMSFSFVDAEQIMVSIGYKTDLFTRQRIERLIEHYKQLITSIVQNKNTPLCALNYLAPDEPVQLIEAFNQTSRHFESAPTIQEIFKEQAQKHHDAVALVCGGREMTFAELDQITDRLADYLIKNYEVKTDDLVALMLEQSELTIIGMLGILKSGAAFLPIDPGNPQERVAYILNDASVKALLTDSNFMFNLIEHYTGQIFALDIQLADLPEAELLEVAYSPQDLIYSIYTSGTTGMPKGVLITNQSLVNYVNWFSHHFNINSSDATILLSSYAFDLGYTGIWSALLSGAKLHIAADNIVKQPDTLVEYLTEHEITYLKTTPSLFYMINQAINFNQLGNSSLRLILLGGEKLRVEDLKRYLVVKQDTCFVNHYGPTESTIGCVAEVIDTTDLDFYADKSIIGSPIANVSAYVMDANLNLVPVGARGELYVAGAGLARGYLNKDELTSAKFISNPHKTGERMYRTGDEVRRLADGKIEFLGRVDRQVKIRGYRVELAEIESLLAGKPGIDKAHVIQKEDGAGVVHLIAYLTVEEAQNVSELRGYLGNNLPEYAIPSYFVEVESFPLTLNGKIDVSRLPNPQELGIIDQSKYVAPSNDTEQELAKIWESVLERENIGVNDNFFEIGGHSLKGVQIVSQIYKEMNAKIELGDIFNAPTIRSLSQVILTADHIDYEDITPVSEQDHYEVSHAQKRLWILDQFEEEQIAYNQPRAYEFKGELNRKALEEAFNTLIDRHESLRTTIITLNGEPRQKVNSREALGFKINYVDLRGKPDKEAVGKEMLTRDAMAPFDLEKGPLLRATLFHVEDEYYIFYLNTHHIISDRWSMGVVVNEILALYNAYKNGGQNPLQPLRIQYKDYSAWQNKMLSGDNLARHQNYWKQCFAGEVPALEMPTTYPRPSVKTYNGSGITFMLDTELAAGLKEISADTGSSIFMTLLAVVKTMLHRYTGQEDITIGTPTAGREHADLEDQIGFYVNTLALRTQFEGQYSFTELLRTIRENTLEAYKHQDYPFDRLVDDLELERDMSRSPLFDVMVALQNIELGESSGTGLEGVNIDTHATEITISQFDLTFIFNETDQGISVSINYNTDLFDEAYMMRFVKHFRQITTCIVNNPGLSVNHYDYLTESEKQQIFTEFKGPDVDFPRAQTLVDIFEQQARNMPDHPALVYENEAITYKELNEKANQLAGLLRSKGIGQGDIVPLLMERTPWLIISILAVFKAGAAYVPLDTKSPQSRNRGIVSDCKASVLITSSDVYSSGSDHLGEIINAVCLRDLVLADDLEDMDMLEDRFKTLCLASFLSGEKELQPEGKKLKPERGLRISHGEIAYSEQELQFEIQKMLTYLEDKQVKKEAQIAIAVDNAARKVITIAALNVLGYKFRIMQAISDRSGMRQWLENHRIDLVIADNQYVNDIDAVYWEKDSNISYLLTDEYNPDKEEDDKVKDFKDIWNYKAEVTTEELNDYGWVNSYDNESFTLEEMEEYIDNFNVKLEPYITPQASVLEIGCGHGLVAFSMAPKAAYYLATDLSEKIVEKNRQRALRDGHGNLEFDTYDAVGIGKIDKKGAFDAIVCSSAVHYFPNTLYLEKVIENAIDLLADEGIIYLDDLIDAHKKQSLIESAEAYNYQHKVTTAKTNWDAELFVGREFFEYIKNKYPEIESFESTGKLGKIDNELTRYRYDVLLRVNKKKKPKAARTNTPDNRLLGLPQFTSRAIDGNRREQVLEMLSFFNACLGEVVDRTGLQLFETDDQYQRPQAQDLAYIIYTSGSTGKPKGVMVEHIGMLNHLYAKINDLNISAESKVVQNASQCFDISVWQSFSALLKGGTTYIYSNDLVLSPENLIQRVQQDEITILEVVPSYLAVMLEVIEGDKQCSFEVLEYLMVTGEAVSKQLVERWFAAFPGKKLVNAYGPTEASDDITHYIIDAVPGTPAISIGKTVQNFNIYILDNQMNLCPIGVKGEICVSGVGVGRGYLNNEEKTLEVFTTDPFRKDEQVRLYKTGDIGRWMPDGNIEYFGRKDYQVKIRGHRIEMGEIENKLTQISEVNEAVVVDRMDQNENKYLAAFITLKAGKFTDTGKVKTELSDQLPEYMVPSWITIMDTLPLTPNGKVDRKALPEDGASDQGRQAYVAPGNPVEEKLVAIWQDVLGREQISIEDNFFEIGGHSLRATRVVSGVHKELDAKIELRSIFNYPTVAQLAAYISGLGKAAYESIKPLDKREHYEVSHAQKRLWVLDQVENGSAAYNIPGAYLFNGSLDREALDKSFEAILKRHEILRTSFVVVDGEPRQKIHTYEALGFGIEYVSLLNDDLTPEKVRQLVDEEATKSFSLNEAPLLRACLFHLEEEKYLFTFTVHHIISDGLSKEILVNELLTLYDAYSQGEQYPLHPLKLHYKDFAAWQNEKLRQSDLKEKTYWLEQLKDQAPRLELPVSKQRPPVKTYNGDSLNFMINPELTNAMHEFSKNNGVSLFMTLSALVKVLLYRYSGQEDITVGTPVAGRNHADLEGQLGLYINTLALRTRFKAEQSFSEMLEHEKETILDAFDNQLYPFDLMVEDLGVKMDRSRYSPLFDVMVQLLMTDAGKQTQKALRNIEVETLTSEKVVSRMDIYFNFADRGEYIEGGIVYNTDIFDEDTIGLMRELFLAVAEACITDPATSLDELVKQSESIQDNDEIGLSEINF